MRRRDRRSLLLVRVHTMRGDGTPRCGWDNVPTGAERVADLPYCGPCLLIDLHQERLDPSHDPVPWAGDAVADSSDGEQTGCRPPDLMPWEARMLLPERWTFSLADLTPWVVSEHRWWFSEDQSPDGSPDTGPR